MAPEDFLASMVQDGAALGSCKGMVEGDLDTDAGCSMHEAAKLAESMIGARTPCAWCIGCMPVVHARHMMKLVPPPCVLSCCLSLYTIWKIWKSPCRVGVLSVLVPLPRTVYAQRSTTYYVLVALVIRTT